MRRTCECGCGKKFEAATTRRRFYAAGCRVRASRSGTVVELPASKPTDSPPAAAGADMLTGVYGATHRALTDADRFDTPHGQAALVLARRIDVGRDTGSAIATMTRQLRETLAEALKGARKEGSKLDELTVRRLERLHRGA